MAAPSVWSSQTNLLDQQAQLALQQQQQLLQQQLALQQQLLQQQLAMMYAHDFGVIEKDSRGVKAMKRALRLIKRKESGCKNKLLSKEKSQV